MHFHRALHETGGLFDAGFVVFCEMVHEEVIADGEVFVMLLHREGHDAHVGNVVRGAGEGDVEISFFSGLPEAESFCNGVFQYVCHEYIFHPFLNTHYLLYYIIMERIYI